MRIGILTQYFPPEMGAPQARLYELAVRLQARGHKITVITAMPNYPTGRIFPEYRGKLFCVEYRDNLRIVRTPIFPSKSANPFVRLFSFMSFVVTSLCMGTWSVGRQDLLVVESPPLFLGLSGIAMSRWIRARMVFMLADIWPDVVIRMGGMISDSQARILERLEGFVYRRAACVAVTNPGAVEQVRGRFPGVPCSVISNGVDTTFFRPGLRSDAVRREFGVGPGQFAVGYCGLHGIFQGLEVAIEAAKRLSDDPRVRFVMIGDGPTKETLLAAARDAGLVNILFHDRQPRSRMPEILGSMDASLIPLAASLPGTMPSKVYEALGTGVPIIVTEGCEGEQLVKRYNVGRLFAPGDAEAVANAVRELAADPSKCREISANAAGLAARFDRDVILERTEKLLLAVHNGDPLPEVEW